MGQESCEYWQQVSQKEWVQRRVFPYPSNPFKHILHFTWSFPYLFYLL
jgi:hypothetical protein